MSDPSLARRLADAHLAGSSDAAARTYAYHAIGVVERESGNNAASMAAFRQGIELAFRTGLELRRVDLAASLGTVLAMAGRRTESLSVFEDALSFEDAATQAQVLIRRAAAHNLLDQPTYALRDCARAIRICAEVGDRVWEARARHNAAVAEITLGRAQAAELQLQYAQRLFDEAGEGMLAAVARQNRALTARIQGDLPRSLELLYDVRERYESLGVTPPEIDRDLALTQLTAGLYQEACDAADHLVERLSASGGLRRADGLVVAAMAHLAGNDVDRAAALAHQAARSNRRQGHTAAERHARIVLLRARFASGKITKRHAKAAVALAAELQDRLSSERLDALVLAGRMAIATGLDDHARMALMGAAAYRSKGSALRRATAWYAKGLLAKLDGDRGGVLRACERGLDVLDTHALSLGATELRARSTVHGSDLAILASRQVIEDGTGREILRWTERWRGTLQSLPWPDVKDDPVLTAQLGKLRAVERDLGAVPTPKQETERRRIEERIRRHVHARPGDPTAQRRKFNVKDLMDTLGDHTTLVSIVGVVGGKFHICVAKNGRVRHLVGGDVDGIEQSVDFARFALRGAALSPKVAAEPLMRGLKPALGALEATMMGDAGKLLGDGPVVIVPPGTIQATPWGALPSLQDREFTVAPSAAAWMRAHQMPEPTHRRTALIGGPNLTTSAREVKLLAESYDDVTVLEGDQATADNSLAAIDGAWLAHVGAHGRFRGDNPMFSALELADGPVNVYDFESLHQAPYRLLLTACESAVTSRAGAEELLGLTTSLSGLGTAGLMASVVPVSDEGSVDLSMIVHEQLRRGGTLASGLQEARRRADDPVSTATAWAFLPLGAA